MKKPRYTDRRPYQNEFALRNNYFEFNGKVKQQISGIAIGTECAPTYACIYMDEYTWVSQFTEWKTSGLT